MTNLATIAPEIERDRYGRPMVTPPGGGKKVPYTRCTTYVDALEDKYNLQKWQQRMVITGLVDRPDLLLSAAAHRDEKKTLDKIADDAIEAAKAHAAATVGTAIHSLTQRVDAGLDIGPVPGEYQRDLDAYAATTEPLTVLHSEKFSVLDDLRIGGTPDRIVEFEGERYIADIKTGSIEWGYLKIAMQLAVYAHSQFYDFKTGERTPLPGVSGQRGLIIHLPAGTGTCTLVWIDLAKGWEAVQLATEVRKKRSLKFGDLTEPFLAPAASSPIFGQIKSCTTPEQVRSLWTPDWTDDLVRVAKERVTELECA